MEKVSNSQQEKKGSEEDLTICNKSSHYVILNVQQYFIFFIWTFFHGHWGFTGYQEKEGDHTYFSLSLPPVHEHSDIYLHILALR